MEVKHLGQHPWCYLHLMDTLYIRQVKLQACIFALVFSKVEYWKSSVTMVLYVLPTLSFRSEKHVYTCESTEVPTHHSACNADSIHVRCDRMKSNIGKTFSAYAHGDNLQGTLEGDNKRPIRECWKIWGVLSAYACVYNCQSLGTHTRPHEHSDIGEGWCSSAWACKSPERERSAIAKAGRNDIVTTSNVDQ
jgi:hypothetical protein